MNHITDTIDEKLREFEATSEDEATAIIMDTYSYAMLREELGVAIDDPFSKYHGLKIKVSDIDDAELVIIV